MAIEAQGYLHALVSLGEDAWLGTHEVILPGINLENNAVVGSSTVVTMVVKSFQVVAEIPAKYIKERQ